MATRKKAKNPLYDGASTCKCVADVNKALSVQNQRLVTTLFTGKVALQTEKVDTMKRGRPRTLLASCCPFCGVGYPDAERSK